MRNLDEIEVPSSPPLPPAQELSSPHSLSTHDSSSPSSRQSSPSPHLFSEDAATDDIFTSTPFNSTSQKRAAAEDFGQVIEAIGREKKLKPNEKKVLSQFSTKSIEEQNLILLSEIMALHRDVSRLAPPDMVYAIPKQLKTLIDVLAIETLLDSSLGGYLEIPLGIVEDALSRTCGFSPEIKENKSSWDTVKSHIRNRLTDIRFTIKSVLLNSVYVQSDKKDGADHVAKTRLSVPKNISETAHALGAINKSVKITVDIEFCGRVAFLRNALVNSSTSTGAPTGADYWKKVDSKLASVREKNNNDPRKLGKFFYTVLEEDMQEFGRVTLATQAQ